MNTLAQVAPSALDFSRARAARLLFMLSVLWGALIFWLAPHPPMVDLPQHAAQVALLRDMLQGQSPWADFFRINPFTPYIIGYGLALPLSLVMPIAAAMKLLLSIAYIAFVGMCVVLRRHFGADARLDWLFLPSFFGFAYVWGFFTFLVAAPIGLLFILLADRYAHRRTLPRAIGLGAAGLILLISHGLVFLFALGSGIALLLSQVQKPKPLLRAALPFALLVLACGIYFLISQQTNAGMHIKSMGENYWGGGISRLLHPLIYSVGANSYGITRTLLVPAVGMLMLMPWLMGLRVNWHNRSSWIPFAVVIFIILCIPSFAFGTAYLYQRFTLFMLPAYAWMFTRQSATPARTMKTAASYALPVFVLICWSLLGLNALRVWKFGQEAADFDGLMSIVTPKHRALGVVLDQDSAADANLRIYAHYPAWYQAERQGLVDFNFGWFPPQIVRYRPEHLPPVPPGFDWFPQSFDWMNNRGSDYTYFFVRHHKAIPLGLFRGARCPPALLIKRGSWTVFERRSCS